MLGTGDGKVDTVVYRFDSTIGTAVDSRGRLTDRGTGTDGGDTINNFELGVDRLILVDTKTTDPIDSLGELITYLSGVEAPGPANVAVRVILGGRDTTAGTLDQIIIQFSTDGKVLGPAGGGNAGSDLTINLRPNTRYSLTDFGGNVNISDANGFLRDPGLAILENLFGDGKIDATDEATLGVDIL